MSKNKALSEVRRVIGIAGERMAECLRIGLFVIRESLRFGWPMILWMAVIDPLWFDWMGSRGHSEVGAASSPLLLLGLCAVMLWLDGRYMAVASVSALYAALYAVCFSLGALAATDWLIEVSLLVTFAAGVWLLVDTAPGLCEALKAAFQAFQDSFFGRHGSSTFRFPLADDSKSAAGAEQVELCSEEEVGQGHDGSMNEK